MSRQSEEPHAAAGTQRLRTSTETPLQDFERQKAVIEREQAATRLLNELTELTKVGRQFLEEAIKEEREAQARRQR